jgi:hypothetical protein
VSLSGADSFTDDSSSVAVIYSSRLYRAMLTVMGTLVTPERVRHFRRPEQKLYFEVRKA